MSDSFAVKDNCGVGNEEICKRIDDGGAGGGEEEEGGGGGEKEEGGGDGNGGGASFLSPQSPLAGNEFSEGMIDSPEVIFRR